MLERLHIRNYRVFNDLEIARLSRINLIAGKNNSGKTSLLEAIFLLAGAGETRAAVNGHINRGLASNVAPGLVDVTFWTPMFSELDMSRAIEITAHHNQFGKLNLKIVSKRVQNTEISLDRTAEASATNLSDMRSLVFHYNGPNDQQVEGQISIKGQGIEVRQDEIDFPFIATLLLSRFENLQEDARRLALLRKAKLGHFVLEALRIIEPRLQSIEDNSASGVPMIWGDIGLSELIPLPVMGEGMTRIARLVLGIASAMDGVVLVDEIENGLHHSILPKVWKVVDTTAKQFKTQVFATTHSFECIEAAHEALGADGFLLHRLEASGTENRCVTYEPEAISAAMRHYMEVR